MRVFQIKTKSKSPKNKANNLTKVFINKRKLSPNNSSQNTRNINAHKNPNIFKKIFPLNKKSFSHFSSSECSLIKTTNFNNSKTNNFIFFESAYNNKDNEILKQIKSLIKHNSPNNFSNIKFINNNNITKKRINNKSKNKKEEINNTKSLNKTSINKTNKLSISTNYSQLFNNKKKEKEKKENTMKSKYINFSDSYPLTKNVSNDLNNFNSLRNAITNKSTKFYNNHKLNNDFKSQTSKEKRPNSTERKNIKSNPIPKKIKNIILKHNNNILKISKSYNDIISYIKNNSKSSSFSPKIKNEEKNLSKINVNKVCHKKRVSAKVSNINKINLQFFKSNSNNNINNIFIKNKFSPVSSKMVDMKLLTKKYLKRDNERILEKKGNNTFFKDNKRIIKNKRVKISTPEENHFLAIINIQKIKQYGYIFN